MLRRLSGQVFAREALIFCEPTYEYNDIIVIVNKEFRLSESFYNLLLNFSIFMVGSLILLWIAIEMRRYGKDPLELAAKTLNCSKTVALVVLVCFTKLAHYGSTKGNRNYTTSQSQSSMVNSSAEESLTDGDTAISIFSVTNLCFSKIQINTNVVSLTAAWPINMFAEGARLDFFAKVGALTNDKQWIGCNDISPAQTNCQHFVNLSDFTSGTNVPAAMFFSVSERSSTASTMNDSDADGIPDVYEFHNDTNPYIADADTMPRLTVGTNAQYATIEAAVSASTNYSVIALSAETFNLNQPLVLPAHPVLLEGPENGYAILRSSASPGVVMLTDGQGVETMIRNVIVDLRATDGFQAGFWIGGNLPWTGVGAAATFENVRVRAPYPGVEYFGWLFYRDDAGPSRIVDCVMNSAGATWAYGISSYNGATNQIDNFACVNMPVNDGESCPIAILVRESPNTTVRKEAPEARSDLSWAGYSTGEIFSASRDSDNDGLSDYDEVFVYDTDPWLADSDADEILDSVEIQAQTDPKDITSYNLQIAVEMTNTVYYADTTNYVFSGDVAEWRSSLLLANAERSIVTNVVMGFTNISDRVSAFTDLNRNGEYDDDYDVLCFGNVVGTFGQRRVRFAFGDIDGDTVDDAQEIADGSDPYDMRCYKITMSLLIENQDEVSGITNYIYSSFCDELNSTNYIGQFVSNTKYVSLNEIVTDAAILVFCFRDFNKNGICDESDIVYKWKFIKSEDDVQKKYLEDCDNDNIPDSLELAEGTNPMDYRSYCYSATALVSSIFSTTNMLKVVSMFGTNVVSEVQLVTNSVQAFDFAHRATGSRERHSLVFWDDVDDDNCIDETEYSSKIEVPVSGHTVSYRARLGYGEFDSDNNGLLDYWESATGLEEVTGPHSADEDTDGDGLVNLHEYWAGTDPLTPDGSNTAYSVLSRSIDERLASVANVDLALPVYSNYYENASNGVFVLNSSRWVSGLDLSGVSVWNNSEHPHSRVGTAISKRHVIFAKHWPLWAGSRLYFLGTNGVVYSRVISDRSGLQDIGGIHNDIAIASLTEELPDSVNPVSVLSGSAYDGINIGKYLPLLVMNQDRQALVHEIEKISYSDDPACTVRFTNSNKNLRQSFYKQVRGLDSSSPSFLVFGNKLVLVGTHWQVANDGSYALDSSLAMYIDRIQSLMDELAPGYQLKTEDFSSLLSDEGGGL